MSYMTGLMLGAAVGRQVHSLLTGKVRSVPGGDIPLPIFRLQHSLPGRRRYRVAVLQQNEPLAALLEEKLIQLPFILRVEAQAATGSLLLVYSGDEAGVDRLAQILEQRIFNVPIVETIRIPENDQGRLAKTGMKMCETIRVFNSAIRRYTADMLDLSSMASLFFIVRGVRKILLQGQAPSGPQMLWWAFSLLRGWRMV